ncbi:hypothetical protein HanPSC8_Chr17g0763921 [Helianthus annuus]|nr:hypothetical protein HanPSC8_Chr17g0763921 [Helianthus annuus]
MTEQDILFTYNPTHCRTKTPTSLCSFKTSTKRIELRRESFLFFEFKRPESTNNQ